MIEKNRDIAFPGFWGIIGIIACSDVLGAHISRVLVSILHYLWQYTRLPSLIPLPLTAAYISHVFGIFFCLYAYSLNNQKTIYENWSALLSHTIQIHFEPKFILYGIILILNILALEILMIGAGLYSLKGISLLGYSMPHSSPLPNSVASSWWYFIFPVLITPFIEEVFFRGIIFQGFFTRYSLTNAILLNSLIFGVSHLSFTKFFSGCVIGVFICWVFTRTQSLILCIFCHATGNALLLSTMTFRIIHIASGVDVGGDTFSMHYIPVIPIWLIVVDVGIIIVGISILSRMLPQTNSR